jgi:hypothetical protein
VRPTLKFSPAQRARVIAELSQLRLRYSKLDMPQALIRELAAPPPDPEACIFARTTETISADLTTRITPCQFGGNPDCSQCGCIASMALAAVGNHKVIGSLTAGHLFLGSDRIGKRWRTLRSAFTTRPVLEPTPTPFKIL